MDRERPDTETELKLMLPEGGRARLQQHHLFQNAPGETRELCSTYFDDEAFLLSRNGIVLRVRADKDHYVQTIKSKARSVATRGEWEWEVGDDQPRPGLLEEVPGGAEIAGRLTSLRPLFRTEISRTTHRLHLDNSVIEAALDQGIVRAGDRTMPVDELELELKDGDGRALYRLALELHAKVPFAISGDTKAARGFRLCAGGVFRAEKTTAVQLDPGASGAGVFRGITNAALAHFLANLTGAEAGDMESIHQVRVALRRLRTVLFLFQPHLDRTAAARFNEEFRRLGRILGAARDWDIFCEEVLPSVGEHTGDARVLDLLADAARAARQEARAVARTELEGVALTGTILGLASWVEDGAASPALLGRATLSQPAGKVLSPLLGRLALKVGKRGRRISHRPHDKLHDLRKSLKKLRYSIDDVRSLYRPRKVRAYLDGCRELQDELGLLNDAVTGVRLACELSAAGRADLAAGLAAVGHWSRKREERVRRKLDAAWADLKHAAPFW